MEEPRISRSRNTRYSHTQPLTWFPHQWVVHAHPSAPSPSPCSSAVLEGLEDIEQWRRLGEVQTGSPGRGTQFN